ncbi:MAG TPA: sigma-54-dependent Fis family transcriptional regulator [Candidatus Cloacimonetes bacterium]|nr:sigma-54-dependent Fis family transcriptional regulator [Candidatus Cloacimonadota bacterium]
MEVNLHKILIIDDDKFVNLTLSKLLRKAGYETKSTFNGKSGINETQHFQPELVLLDFKLPDLNGFQILKKIKKINSSIIVIMITSFGEIRRAVKSIKLGAYDFFTKPFDNKEILEVVKKALSSTNKENETQINIKKMMGESKPLQNVLKNIERVADKDITVFLEGETGTGKELFARMIHQKSNRKDKPFITVDCGAIPETLFESELFGHRKGAFTGSLNDKKGKFELANKGTLFLDEINSLPMSMQPKFLRVLQEGEIQRLGDERSIDVNVRIIAASNSNIYDDVKKSQFREDLFYRIHEFKIDLPTLHQRKDDIPVIANYFLQELAEIYQKSVSGFTNQAMSLLLNYQFPGNVRELKNIIKSAILLTDSDKIEPEHLILKNIRNKDLEKEDDSEDLLLEKFTDKAEIKIIKKALEKAKYNKSEAAELLGISRSQFYKKLEKFGL